MLQCIRTGRNPTMRHLQRTHRVQVSWIHERYTNQDFLFNHEGGDRMPPDVFTKMFADKDKWIRARQLINIVMPSELDRIIEDCKQIYAGIQEKPAFAAEANDAPDTRGEPEGDGGFTAPSGGPGAMVVSPRLPARRSFLRGGPSIAFRGVPTGSLGFPGGISRGTVFRKFSINCSGVTKRWVLRRSYLLFAAVVLLLRHCGQLSMTNS